MASNDGNIEKSSLSHVNTEGEEANVNKTSSIENTDNDLDALLDDALEDFSKPQAKPKTEQAKANPQQMNNPDGDVLFENLIGDDSLLEMTSGLNNVLEQMANADPTMMAEFQKFQESAMPSEGTGEAAFGIDENIAKTMEELTKNLQGLETGDNISMEEMMRQAQQELGNTSDQTPPTADSFMGMMQGMMDNLLSKEMLYPSLKEIDDKYPSWLTENKEKISSEEFTKYNDQQKIVHKLCLLFENEKETDAEDLKKQRSAKVVDLMQKMQRYGHPPADMMATIVGDEEGGTQAGPPMPECSIM